MTTSFGIPMSLADLQAYSPEEPRDQPWSSGDRCRVFGCREEYVSGQAGGNGGKGFCAKHYRNLLRAGHPEGRQVRVANALLEAVFAWAEDPSYEGPLVDALVMACFDTLAPSSVPERTGNPTPEALRSFLSVAARFADFDDAPEADQAFVAMLEELRTAARAFAKGFSVFHSRGHLGYATRLQEAA